MVDAFAQMGEVFSDELGRSQYFFWGGDDADYFLVQDL